VLACAEGLDNQTVLQNSLDRQPLPEATPSPPPPTHDNIRGAEYFE
jgi:hypothetical protein